MNPLASPLLSLSDDLLATIAEYAPKESKTVRPLRIAYGSLLNFSQNSPSFIDRIAKRFPIPSSANERVGLETKVRQVALQEMNDNRNKFRVEERPHWKPIEMVELPWEEINKMGEKIQAKKDQILVTFFESICFEYPAIQNALQIPQDIELFQKAKMIREWIANRENQPLIEACHSFGFFQHMKIPPEALAFINLRLSGHQVPNQSLDTLRVLFENPQPIDPHQLGGVVLNAVEANDSYMLKMVLNAKRPIGFLGAAVTHAINNHQLDLIDCLYNHESLRTHPCLFSGLNFAVGMGKGGAVRTILRSDTPFTTKQLVSLLSKTSNEAIRTEIQARLNQHSKLAVATVKTISWVRSFCPVGTN